MKRLTFFAQVQETFCLENCFFQELTETFSLGGRLVIFSGKYKETFSLCGEFIVRGWCEKFFGLKNCFSGPTTIDVDSTCWIRRHVSWLQRHKKSEANKFAEVFVYDGGKYCFDFSWIMSLFLRRNSCLDEV